MRINEVQHTTVSYCNIRIRKDEPFIINMRNHQLQHQTFMQRYISILLWQNHLQKHLYFVVATWEFI
jgi:hypothetical protein